MEVAGEAGGEGGGAVDFAVGDGRIWGLQWRAQLCSR
jgi:hypothetical protein